MSEQPHPRRQAAAVLRNELRGLMRDRRALFLGFVLPILLYPLIFFGSERLGRASRQRVEQRTVQVATDLAAATPEVTAGLRGAVDEVEGGPTEWIELDVPDGALDAAAVRALLGTELDVLVRATLEPDSDALRLEVHGDFASEDGAEARRRVRTGLGTLRRELTQRVLERELGGDPAAPLVPVEIDVATAEDRSGLALGRILPLIAILVLVSGGSFAALDAFAGERERGTLETLLVQPVPASAVAWGKYAAVLLASLAALLGNFASLAACLWFDLGEPPGFSAASGPAVLPSAARLVAGAALFVPVAALVAAVLAAVCARARSYREGQHYLMPVTLAAMVPGALAAAPEVELDAFTALLPIAGPALALRDALRGGLPAGSFVMVCVASVAWAGLVVRSMARRLDAERLLADRDDESELAQRHIQSRAALRWGFASILLVYLIGSRLQEANPLFGLLATLWLLVPALALAAARGTALRGRIAVREVLGLRSAAPRHLLGALWIAPGIAWLMQLLLTWQSSVLPVPGELAEATPIELFGTDNTALLLFAIAISPAVCEELLFRGALLSGLRADLSPWRCVAWQAVLFALVHLSVHRALPTAILGALLATLTLRARSLWPAVLLHGSYNALLVSSALESEAVARLISGPWAAASLVGGALLLATARAPRAETR